MQAEVPLDINSRNYNHNAEESRCALGISAVIASHRDCCPAEMSGWVTRTGSSRV